MRFLLIALLTVASISHAQEKTQTRVIVGGALKNLLKLPEEALFSLARPFKKKKMTGLMSRTDEDSDIPLLARSCEERCPDNMHLLRTARLRMLADKGHNLLSFLNEKSDFKDHIQRTVGYCWGHSSVTRNFNYLAYFDPHELKEKAPGKDDPKFGKFYKKKIKNIMALKAQVIPGYENLREFSADPVIKKMLKDEVVWEWADKALRIRSASVFATGTKGQMKPRQLKKFLDSVEERLKANHVPKIFFTNRKKPGFIHIVNVNEIRRLKNEIRVCILDNHQYEEELRNCGVYVSIDLKKNEFYYEGWNNPVKGTEGFVGQFGFTPEDETEMLKFQKETRKMCLKQCQRGDQ